MMMAIKFILLVICVLIAYVLGYVFTETKYDLQKYPIFDFEAFKCRQCLSFHISWVLSTFISLLFNDWIMVIVGIIFALFLFIGLKIDENKRMIN
jgi:hypothetical protein